MELSWPYKRSIELQICHPRNYSDQVFLGKGDDKSDYIVTTVSFLLE